MVASADPVSAQTEDPELGWSDTAELTFVFTGGNAESGTVGFKNELRRAWEGATWVVDVNTLRTESTTLVRTAQRVPAGLEVTETAVAGLTAANYYARSRYDRKLSDRTFWFGGGGWERNTFSGVEHRFTANGGVGNTWIDTERTSLTTAYGASVTTQNDVVDAENADTFPGLRLSYELRQQVTANTELTSALLVDQNLDDVGDIRSDLVNAVTIDMNAVLALTVRWRLLFDGRPSLVQVPIVDTLGGATGDVAMVEAEAVDSFLTFALVASF